MENSDNLQCSDCKYKEDFTPDGCLKCNTCDWGIGASGLHNNFEPIDNEAN